MVLEVVLVVLEVVLQLLLLQPLLLLLLLLLQLRVLLKLPSPPGGGNLIFRLPYHCPIIVSPGPSTDWGEPPTDRGRRPPSISTEVQEGLL